MSKSKLKLTKKNFILFGVGLLVLLLGFVSLHQGPANNPISLTLGPVLLVIAYCILIPAAIMLKDKEETSGT
ncbi:MAG: hypothetical protein DWQ06_15415 [Calditrichaeota bacterium]|nr:MAG: hypothetical protein DWQ06_15415 [Calditrichota bacterium]